MNGYSQEGQWKVGGGEYAGRGVYFGLEKRTAENYARGNTIQGLIVARVTLSPIRNVSSLGKVDRTDVGSDGGTMSQRVPPIWRTLEHWRVGSEWWEYCLIHRGDVGDYIKTWRIRPVAFLDKDGGLKRLWKGQAHYSLNTFKSFVVGVICTALMIPFVGFALGLLVQIFG